MKMPGNKLTVRVMAAASGIAMIFSICAAQDIPSANGIWARGDLVILFARLNNCGAPYRPVQPLVSTDGGKTWGATGPRLESSDLEYFLDAGSELFIAGEDIAEGPAHSPFLLVYRASDNAWQQSEIYDQASELLGIGVEAKTGRFLAWVRHLELEKNGDWSGPIFLHRSPDGGKTWSVVRKVRRVPRMAPGLRFFRGHLDQSGSWRLTKTGSRAEHRQDDGTWHLVTLLPLPIQEACSN
jgi:hypothetical protein